MLRHLYRNYLIFPDHIEVRSSLQGLQENIQIIISHDPADAAVANTRPLQVYIDPILILDDIHNPRQRCPVENELVLLPGKHTVVPDTGLFQVLAIPRDEIAGSHVHVGPRQRMNDHTSFLKQYIVPAIFVDDIESGPRDDHVKATAMNDKAASLRRLPYMKKSLPVDPYFPVS